MHVAKAVEDVGCLTWLAGLPAEIRLSLPDGIGVLLVHAAPGSDDGPGLGQVPARSSLGLSITRALVASFGGSLELRPAAVRGVIATIGLHAAPTRAVAS